MTASRCRLTELPRIGDARGALGFVEEEGALPFAARRVFWVYDAPAGATRGRHAHRECAEYLICLQGSVRVRVEEAGEPREFLLDSPARGLFIPPLVWIEYEMASAETILVVLASHLFDPADHIKDKSSPLLRGADAPREETHIP